MSDDLTSLRAAIRSLANNTASGSPQRRKPAPIVEATVATLREFYERYAAPCAFKPGDLVTPRPGTSYTMVGLPAIVLEIADPPHRNFNTASEREAVSNGYGKRFDMRVMQSHRESDMAAFWVESFEFEAFVTEEEKK